MEMPFHNKYNTMKIKPERISMFFIVTGLVKVVKQLISSSFCENNFLTQISFA
jgi:hypothetical protein